MQQEDNKADKTNFLVHNVYLIDVSFEAPNTPHIFSIEWKPKLDFDLQIGYAELTEGVYEVLLHITVTVKLPRNKKDQESEEKKEETAFLVEVKQGGVFSLQGFAAEKIDHILSTAAPSILFPYLREAVSSLVTKGGFPQLVLPPVNFEGMYQQRLQEKANKE